MLIAKKFFTRFITNMNINNLTFTNQYNFKSTFFLNDDCLKVHKNKNNEEFITCNIYDKNYNFKLNEETKDAVKLNMMIENIKKMKSGFFIRQDKHEYFVPYILNKFPDIIKHIHVVENGNAQLKLNEESVSAKDVIESHVKREVDVNNLKVIKYLKRTEKGFDGNNIIKAAYSYIDKIKNDLYLYIPEKKIIQILFNDSFIKKIKL